MSTVRRRRLAATALVTTALLTLGGCGTGFSADTNRIYQAAVGADHRGEMDVLNTLFVANEDGSATLSASIVNNAGTENESIDNNTDAEDELTSIAVTTLDGETLEVKSTKKRLPLKPGILSLVGGAGDAGGFWVTEGATAGDYVKVTLTFREAAPVTIEAPVVTRTAEYDKVVKEPTPEPTPTPTETESTENSAE